MVPLAIFFLASHMLVQNDILTWADPLAQFMNPGDEAAAGAKGGVTVELKTHHGHKLADSTHSQDYDVHLSNVVPERVPLAMAKRYAGHKFSQEGFDAIAVDGSISRAEFLANKHEL
jgi:hypothetical protein